MTKGNVCACVRHHLVSESIFLGTKRTEHVFLWRHVYDGVKLCSDWSFSTVGLQTAALWPSKKKKQGQCVTGTHTCWGSHHTPSDTFKARAERAKRGSCKRCTCLMEMVEQEKTCCRVRCLYCCFLYWIDQIIIIIINIVKWKAKLFLVKYILNALNWVDFLSFLTKCFGTYIPIIANPCFFVIAVQSSRGFIRLVITQIIHV